MEKKVSRIIILIANPYLRLYLIYNSIIKIKSGFRYYSKPTFVNLFFWLFRDNEK